MTDSSEIVLYQPDDAVKLEVRLEDETVWLTQAQMAELFEKDRTVITRHINNIFAEGELEEYEKQYKSEVAELKRRLRAGSIGNKGYQKAFTPLRKKMEQRKFDLDNFKVKSINEIFERGDSISDDGYFEYIKDFLKARKWCFVTCGKKNLQTCAAISRTLRFSLQRFK